MFNSINYYHCKPAKSNELLLIGFLEIFIFIEDFEFILLFMENPCKTNYKVLFFYIVSDNKKQWLVR